jgi:Tol biopolymer transport system component
VIEGIFVAPTTGAVQASISSTGTLVYAPVRPQDRKTRLVAFDLEGKEQPLSDFLPMLFSELALAPDGRRVAVRVANANDDIHFFDIGRSSLTRFTYESGDEENPVWSPDGKRLADLAQHGATPQIFWKTVEGNSTPERIQDSRYSQRPYSFSPDGRYLAYSELHPQTMSALWTVRLERGSPPRAEPFLRTAFSEDVPVFSPNGHWIAYQSDESGRLEVYVAQFPGAAIKRQISTDGGAQPMWAPDGKRLFFLNGKQVMYADLNIQDMQPGRPRKLFEIPFHMPFLLAGIGGRTGAVFPDGKRLLFVEESDPPDVRELVVVLNWFEQLRRKIR